MLADTRTAKTKKGELFMKNAKIWLAVFLAAVLAVSCTVALAVTAEELPDTSNVSEAVRAGIGAVNETPATDEVPAVDEPPVADEAPAVDEAPAADEAPAEEEDKVGIEADDEITVNAESKLFGEERLLLVTVNNNNKDVNYSISVKVTYYGADGEALETEAKSFEQLANGYDKNFIFRPGYDFVDYLIEVEKTVYEGDCWKTLVDAEFGYTYVWVYGDDRDTRVRQHIEVTSHSEGSLVVDDFEVVVFDENGDIFDIFYRAGCWINPLDNQYKHFAREMTVPDSMVYFEGYETKIKLGGAFIEYDIIAPEETPDYDYLISNGYIDPETGAFRNPKDEQ